MQKENPEILLLDDFFKKFSLTCSKHDLNIFLHAAIDSKESFERTLINYCQKMFLLVLLAEKNISKNTYDEIKVIALKNPIIEKFDENALLLLNLLSLFFDISNAVQEKMLIVDQCIRNHTIVLDLKISPEKKPFPRIESSPEFEHNLSRTNTADDILREDFGGTFFKTPTRRTPIVGFTASPDVPDPTASPIGQKVNRAERSPQTPQATPHF